jgi:hypothetical protein
MLDVPRGALSEPRAIHTLAYAVKRKLTFPLAIFISLWAIWAILMTAFAIDCFATRNKPGFNVPLGALGSFELLGGLFTAGYLVVATALTVAVWIYRVLRFRRAAKHGEAPSPTRLLWQGAERMPTGNQSSGGEPAAPPLQYFTPLINGRPAWDPRDLLPTILVLLVLGFDLLMAYLDQLSNDRGLYIVAILPPVVLLGIAAYAFRAPTKTKSNLRSLRSFRRRRSCHSCHCCSLGSF